ncbi:MAG: hypothetical protein Q7V17_19015 [Afipia sp.]|nr:hypothetical protein [Afipia sp.]
MGLLNITGTVTAHGQSQFDNHLTIYAYLEITEPSGRRIQIDKVAVCNDTAALLQLGSAGEFFLDKMFVYGRRFHCQLWGIKAESMAVFDRHNLRKTAMIHHILLGMLLLPIGGLGAFWLLPGLANLLTMISGSVNRGRLFYGSNPAEVRRLQQQQAVRI